MVSQKEKQLLAFWVCSWALSVVSGKVLKKGGSYSAHTEFRVLLPWWSSVPLSTEWWKDVKTKEAEFSWSAHKLPREHTSAVSCGACPWVSRRKCARPLSVSTCFPTKLGWSCVSPPPTPSANTIHTYTHTQPELPAWAMLVYALFYSYNSMCISTRTVTTASSIKKKKGKKELQRQRKKRNTFRF